MSQFTRYITVDMVIKTNEATDHLIHYLDQKGYYTQKHEWNEGDKWYLNISCPHDFDTPESCILKYCEDLAELPSEALTEWESANFKELFIGYSTGTSPHCVQHHIPLATISTLSSHGLGLGIAIYSQPEPVQN
jgi:hypothetical protein